MSEAAKGSMKYTPAFPQDLRDKNGVGIRYFGMSMRQWYAGLAMQGLVARIGPHDADLIAHDSMILADAMIKAGEA